MKDLRTIGKLVLIILVVFLIISNVISCKKSREYLDKYTTSVNNYKAIEAENSIFQKDKLVMSMTIDQLKYFNDSITYKLNDARKSLKLKDSEIKSLQYYKERFGKKDTLIFKDTIFVKDLKIDTTIVDSFYTCNLKLQYPNLVTVSPEFINEKMVFVTSHKETIEPPKKWWILRIFQKKHTVLIINIKDTNPYCKTLKSRFIEILK